MGHRAFLAIDERIAGLQTIEHMLQLFDDHRGATHDDVMRLLQFLTVLITGNGHGAR
jgi:hypothetical protein